jgi:hypothetical protein
MAAPHLPRAMAAAFGGRGVGGARGRRGCGGGGRRPRRGRSGGAAASLLLTVALIVPEVDAAHLGAGVFATTEELELARDEWHTNAAQAEAKHGRPSGWDVSRIADLSELFQGTAASCSGTPSGGVGCYRVNEMNIEQWDTSRVTSLTNTFHTAEDFNANLVWEYAAPQPSRRPAAALRGRV